MYFDCNYKELKNGDIIDIHQTVNGRDKFIVLTVDPLCIVYAYDRECKYEYNQEDLLKPCVFSGETDWEIIGTVEDV